MPRLQRDWNLSNSFSTNATPPDMPAAKFRPVWANTDHHPAGHVFAAVIARAFDHRPDAAVPHRKPLSRHPVEIGFALRPAIERRVADQNRLFRRIDRVLRG